MKSACLMAAVVLQDLQAPKLYNFFLISQSCDVEMARAGGADTSSSKERTGPLSQSPFYLLFHDCPD